MANNKGSSSDDKLLIWGIVLLFLFFPAGIILLIVYADKKKSKKVAPAVQGGTYLRANKNNVICVEYKVKGKNPETGRQKGVNVFTESTASAETIQNKSGLLPPYKIEPVAPTPPTENQISYASKFGFAFPPDATIKDASVFLTRAENDEPLVQPITPDWMVRYVISKDIYVPSYGGSLNTSAAYLYGCTKKEKAAFFCMRVYCTIFKKQYKLLENATPNERSLFDEFANLYSEDPDFVRSLEHYTPAELPLDRCLAVRRLKAFDLVSAFFRIKGVVK